MSAFLAAAVEGRPFAVPVKGYAIRTLVHLIQLLQILVFDQAIIIDIKQPERNLVFSVWFREEVLEDRPVLEVDFSGVATVGDGEEDAVLFAFDFVLLDCQLLFMFISSSHPSNHHQKRIYSHNPPPPAPPPQ